MKLSQLFVISATVIQVVHSNSSPDCADPDVTRGMEEKKRQEWPEAVGMTGEEAKAIVERENTDATRIEIVPKDAMVTMDYRTDRVRIRVDENGFVVKTPKIG